MRRGRGEVRAGVKESMSSIDGGKQKYFSYLKKDRLILTKK